MGSPTHTEHSEPRTWPAVPVEITSAYVGARVARTNVDAVTTGVLASITSAREVHGPNHGMLGFSDSETWHVHPDDEPLDERIELVAEVLWSRSHAEPWEHGVWPLDAEWRKTYEDARAVLVLVGQTRSVFGL